MLCPGERERATVTMTKPSGRFPWDRGVSWGGGLSVIKLRQWANWNELAILGEVRVGFSKLYDK